MTPLLSGRGRIQTQVHLTSELVSFAVPPTLLSSSVHQNLACLLHNPAAQAGPGRLGLWGTFLSLPVPCPPRGRLQQERPSSRPHEELPSCLSSGPAVICSACSANFLVSKHGIWYSFAWINVQPLSSSGESYSSPKFRPARLNNSTKMLG